MKILALTFSMLVFVFASCKTDSASEVFFDADGALTTKNITQNRDMTQYKQGGHFYCRTRSTRIFGNEKDKLEGEKKVRDFIWEHLIEKKRGYIRLSCPGTDTSNTTHYFIESNENGERNVARRNIFQASDNKITRNESFLNSFERVENKETGDWFLVSKSANGEIIERLPIY